MTPSLTIDVFSDVVCPWCFIGSTRLELALDGLKHELQAEVCYHPFFLKPGTPREGISIPDMLRRKYGADPKALWARAEAAAKDSGLELDLSLQPKMYPTDGAHTLLRHAHPRGTQRTLVSALFRAYFQQARDIADTSVLAEIATEHGFAQGEALELVSSGAELELTRDEAMSAAQGGIQGVPFFVFGGRLAVSGAQSVAVLTSAMQQALTRASLPPDAAP